jgi:hypothetical protein
MLQNDGRFSPDSLAERLVQGTEQGIDKLTSSAFDILEPFHTGNTLESERYKHEVDEIRSFYKDKFLDILKSPRKLAKFSIGTLEEFITGGFKVTSSLTDTAVNSLTLPFSGLGPRESMFVTSNEFIQASPVSSSLSSYIGQVSSDFFQTTFGYGGKNSINWQTGLVGGVKWATGSSWNIAKNALTLRPVKTANAIAKAGGDGFDLAKNTIFSTGKLFKNTIFGATKSLLNESSAHETTSSQPVETPKQAKPSNPKKPKEDFDIGNYIESL